MALTFKVGIQQQRKPVLAPLLYQMQNKRSPDPISLPSMKALCYAEAMLVAYNRKGKYPLQWNRLYEKSLETSANWDMTAALLEKDEDISAE